MTGISTLLGGLSAAEFLRTHWQRKPLLVRGAFPSFADPVSAEELAGLACETDVESRLIVLRRGRWRLTHGPFEPAGFESLPDRGWTLLVQAVDHWLPEVAALLAPFRFIPSWRLDDVMISYAAPGGGVGPHFDRYDVFLIQGQGRRCWRLGGSCDASTRIVERGGVRQLAAFEATEEHVLEPGDMLYLPPGIAHDGEAVDACLTYSVGFRAPSAAEIVDGFAGALIERLGEDWRYTDRDLLPADVPGEIGRDTLVRLRAVLDAAMRDDDALTLWFGRFMTEPKYEHLPTAPRKKASPAEVRAAIHDGCGIAHAPGSRFAFTSPAGGTGEAILFIDGSVQACSGRVAELARLLCSGDVLSPAVSVRFMEDAASLELLTALINSGSLRFEE